MNVLAAQTFNRGGTTLEAEVTLHSFKFQICGKTPRDVHQADTWLTGRSENQFNLLLSESTFWTVTMVHC